PYAPGLPIGEVVDVTGTAGQLARIATVRPFADVSQLSVVGVVVKPPREDPRDSVLPNAPAATRTPTPEPSPTASQDKETAATPAPDGG
ncbi:MAG: rod shape-determining protein MreC, partial [Actinomycetia bacterium]|nr:rod shape-determining protein MreC [Actinomycetes bacterium]